VHLRVENGWHVGLTGDKLFMVLRSLFARAIISLIKANILWIAYYEIVKEAKLGSQMLWNNKFMCNASFDL
jgi:hypothetical protein